VLGVREGERGEEEGGGMGWDGYGVKGAGTGLDWIYLAAFVDIWIV
jgi:hypothetical protein